MRELINRIGAQAAVVRRSIDRLGENQSIELCDDWVIPYIGDLVATRLVSCLDADAQRIDVAKTIYYRRRAGTVGVLEELAADIASSMPASSSSSAAWDAHAISSIRPSATRSRIPSPAPSASPPVCSRSPRA